MTDVHTKEQRSRNMAAIRSKNTKPELMIRRLIHSMGFRYRLHKKDLPGKPDLVFPGLKKVIFVHGCYWHMHNCKFGKVRPKTNARFWSNKRKSNVVRDKKNITQLKVMKWKSLVVWACQIKNEDRLRARVLSFLSK